MPNVLEELNKPFSASEVKQRDGGFGKKLDYVGWDSVVRRLNDVVGAGWSISIKDSSATLLPGQERNGKPMFLAQVRGSLTILIDGDYVTREGVGADVDTDPDKALKTAQAEALKKAGNQFGIALELWTEEGREAVAKGRVIEAGDLGSLKRAAFEKAIASGADATPESVAEKLGITVEELQDAEVLRRILKN